MGNPRFMKTLSPARLIAMVAAIEFIYILDFMMVLPLGPDLAKAHHFNVDLLGWISAVFTLVSVLAGWIAIQCLDRFDRRPALITLLILFTASTASTALIQGFNALLLMRAITGLLGGPAVALGFALLIDATPPEQRGRAIGRVMLGFSLAAILGVPLVLELSRYGWQIPFVSLALISSLVCVWLGLALPSMRQHLHLAARPSLTNLLQKPLVRLACWIQAGSQFAAFLIIPYFSAYFLLNLDVSREHLGWLYAVGGISAFALVQLATWSMERVGARLLITLAIIGFALGLSPFWGWLPLPLVLMFALFMASNAVRNVVLATVTSTIPSPHERAGFMSLQNIIQDIGMTAAAIVASQMVQTSSQGKLTGLAAVAVLSLVSLLVIALVFLRLEQRQQALLLNPISVTQN